MSAHNSYTDGSRFQSQDLKVLLDQRLAMNTFRLGIGTYPLAAGTYRLGSREQSRALRAFLKTPLSRVRDRGSGAPPVANTPYTSVSASGPQKQDPGPKH